jgi:hypothetical protein
VRSGPEKTAKNKKKKRKKKYSGQQQKEMGCDEPHPVPNEKTQPIQRTERPTDALVAAGSLWPCFSRRDFLLPATGFCGMLRSWVLGHSIYSLLDNRQRSVRVSKNRQLY